MCSSDLAWSPALIAVARRTVSDRISKRLPGPTQPVPWRVRGPRRAPAAAKAERPTRPAPTDPAAAQVPENTPVPGRSCPRSRRRRRWRRRPPRRSTQRHTRINGYALLATTEPQPSPRHHAKTRAHPLSRPASEDDTEIIPTAAVYRRPAVVPSCWHCGDLPNAGASSLLLSNPCTWEPRSGPAS